MFDYERFLSMQLIYSSLHSENDRRMFTYFALQAEKQNISTNEAQMLRNDRAFLYIMYQEFYVYL